jgi:nucleoid-associated protein YgaU
MLPLHSRYVEVGAIEIDGQVSLRLRPDPLPVGFPDSVTHIVVGDETLDYLALKYYGREELWWRIADANVGRPALSWQAGDRLVIPPLRAATRTPPEGR